MHNEIQELVAMTRESLVEAVDRLLGKDGAAISKKIADSVDTPEGLRAAMHQCEKISKLTIEADKCDKLKIICEAMIKDLDHAVVTLSDDSDTSQQDRKVRMVKAKLITIASKVYGIGADGLKITAKLRNAPESVEGLRGSLQECEKLATLTSDPKKVTAMKLNSDKVMAEIA